MDVYLKNEALTGSVIKTILLTLLTAALIGCGGGGGTNANNNGNNLANTVTGNTDTSNTASSTLSGIAADGYLENAIVCLDTDSDGSCTGEASVVRSDSNGQFTLSSVSTEDFNRYSVLVEAIKGITKDKDLVTADNLDGYVQIAFTLTAPAGFLDSSSGEVFVSPFTTLLAKRAQSIMATSNQDVSSALAQAKAELEQELGFSEDDNFNFLSDYVALQDDTSIDADIREQAASMHGTARILTGLLSDVQEATATAATTTDSGSKKSASAEDVATDGVFNQVNEVLASVEEALDEASIAATTSTATTTSISTTSVSYNTVISGILGAYRKHGGGHRYGHHDGYVSTTLTAIANMVNNSTTTTATTMLNSTGGVSASFPQYVYGADDTVTTDDKLVLKSKTIGLDATANFVYSSKERNLATKLDTDTSAQTNDIVILAATGWSAVTAKNHGAVSTDGAIGFYYNSSQTTPFATTAASVTKLGDLSATDVTIATTMGYLHGGAKKISNLLNSTATFPIGSEGYLASINYTAQTLLDNTAAITSYTGAVADSTAVSSLTDLQNANGTALFTSSTVTSTLKSIRLSNYKSTATSTLNDTYELFVTFIQGATANAGTALYFVLYTDVSAGTATYTQLRSRTYSIAASATAATVQMLTVSSLGRGHHGRRHGSYSGGRGNMTFSAYNGKIYPVYQHGARTVERLFLNQVAQTALVAAISDDAVNTVSTAIVNHEANQVDSYDTYHSTHGLFHYMARESRHYLRNTVSLFFKL